MNFTRIKINAHRGGFYLYYTSGRKLYGHRSALTDEYVGQFSKKGEAIELAQANADERGSAVLTLDVEH